MKELSLFTGAGGGLLGTKLLGWRCVGYVEKEDYCQRIIAQRIKDGVLDKAPIFGDIREFIGDGYAERYRGMVDVITAGFPCQPFSTAGKRLGSDDERNMWPATIECIRVVRPKYALLENVPGIISSGYFGTILGDLAESGYDARWRILSAAELGAPHRRDRLWIVAYTDKEESWRLRIRETETVSVSGISCDDVSYSNKNRRRQVEQSNGTRAEAERAERAAAARSGSWWSSEPDVGRVVDGLAHRVDRIRAIGNGQVPAVVARVWNILTNDL